MYEEYWQLEAKPFEPAGEEQFFFPSPSHQAALHKLRYALENRRSAVLLTGMAGVGKTLLWENLASQLGDSLGCWAHVVFPLLSPRELLGYVAGQLGAAPDQPQPGTEDCLRSIEHTLLENQRRGKLAVLAVDEAHLLEDAGLLEPLRLLLNLGSGRRPLFTLLLIGQIPAVLALDRCNRLDERLEMQVLLRPFTGEETIGYIEHRLVSAGATRPLFSEEALVVVHQLTDGIARRINRLCDLALLVGFAAGESEIDAALLRGVHAELVTVSVAA
jgi:general secretion pathway protein A